MITVKVIFENSSLKPESNETKGFGSHCDGENFYFFESNEEREEFLKKLETKYIE